MTSCHERKMSNLFRRLCSQDTAFAGLHTPQYTVCPNDAEGGGLMRPLCKLPEISMRMTTTGTFLRVAC